MLFSPPLWPRILIAVLLTLAGFSQTGHALPILPGGQGFGMETPAGSGPNRSGGAILHVTTLADSGPGSLREALHTQGPRIVVFDVSGYIQLQSAISVTEPYLTIAGQTAPFPGVTLKGAGILVSTHDVLIQHIRIRVGDDPNGPDPMVRDGLAIIDANNEGDVHNVVVDHVSVSWAIDENVSTWYDGVHDVTISNSIISEGLWHSLHPEGPHSKGLLVGNGTHNLSVTGNLFAHNDERNMRVLGDTGTLFLNNLVYNWRGTGGAGVYGSDSGPLLATLAGNEYVKGQDTLPEGSSLPVTISSTLVPAGTRIYLDDNVAVEATSDPWSVVENKSTDEIKADAPPVWIPGIAVKSGAEVRNWVLNQAGARRADGEAVDVRVTQGVLDGTGRIIDSQNDVGGWPPLAENVRGRNGVPPLAVPPGNIQPSGYTDVEEWLHGLAEEVSVSSAATGAIRRGPYLQEAGENSIRIKWRTTLAGAGNNTVHYGTARGFYTASATATTLPANCGAGCDLREHEALLTGLSAGSRYYYALGTETAALTEPTAQGHFSTAAPAGTARLTRIWAVGDSGTANAGAAIVRNAFKVYSMQQPADLFLMLGDNAYNTGTDGEYQSAVFDMYRETLRSTPLWPTLGNHDGQTAFSATETGPYYEIFSLPKNAEAGGTPSGTEAYYSFDHANIHFISLNSYDVDRGTTGAMLNWLENDLMNTAQDWIIAFWHHPPYSKGSHDSDVEIPMKEMRENVLPLLESYGVDLVLSGHSHSYERSFLIDGHYGTSAGLDAASMILDPGNGWPLPEDQAGGAYVKNYLDDFIHQGAVYAVAGSSGKVTEAPLNHPAMQISLAKPGSMAIDIYGDRLDAAFIGADGVVEDHFTLVHTPRTYPPALIRARPVDSTTVELRFTEPLESLSAQDPAHYAIDGGLTVDGAALSGDFRSVLLSLPPMTPETLYTVTVSGVKGYQSGLAIPPPGAQAQFIYVAGPEVLDRRVSASSDDAEESASGSMSLGSSDLEMVFDGSDQTVGMRFNNVDIPACASIDKAHVQFQSDEVNTGVTTLAIQGEKTLNAATFTSSKNNIGSRTRTAASVPWAPTEWLIVGQAGSEHRTPDISAIIQEIIDQPGWSAGASSLAILISGTGERTAVSFDGIPSGAPLLHVEYFKSYPLVTASAPADGMSVFQGTEISFSAVADDCQDGDLSPQIVWTSSLDGPLNGGQPASSFAASALSAGTHIITASASNSASLTGHDTLTVTVLKATGNNPVGGVSDADPAANAAPETAAPGTPVGLTAQAVDPDAADTVGYAIIGGGPFAIDPATGVVTVASALDYETAQSHAITIRATSSDTTSSEAAFTISVIDVVEGVSRIRSPIDYATTGGKNNDKHLLVTLTVEDDNGNAVAGASVSVVISGPSPLSATQTTDGAGKTTFSIKNARLGVYSVTATDVTASGLTWDGVTPVNSYSK